MRSRGGAARLVAIAVFAKVAKVPRRRVGFTDVGGPGAEVLRLSAYNAFRSLHIGVGIVAGGLCWASVGVTPPESGTTALLSKVEGWRADR